MTSSICTVVFDDDPTGTQTVHSVPVLTTWSCDVLETELRQSDLFYVLTNSRALTAAETTAVHRELLDNLIAAAEGVSRTIELVSRSDSTLRGHYPLECDLILETFAEIGQPFDGTVIVPCFPEGGRVTLNDVHYATIDGERIPVGDTEFARDRSFGFGSSNLKKWVEEKSDGRTKADAVLSVSPDDDIAATLSNLPPNPTVIVNAESYEDLETVVDGIRSTGKRFLYRSAASLVKVIGGIESRPLLDGHDLLNPNGRGGLVVVGSHTAKTTAQLDDLLRLPSTEGFELRVAEILQGDAQKEIVRVAGAADGSMASGKTTVVYTSRTLQTATSGRSDANLSVATTISEAVIAVVRQLRVTPGFMIAKGGITSSDVATKGLGIRRATVLGQALPGVPVWRCGPETRFPGLAYVIFPGNVGQAKTLERLVTKINTTQIQ